MIFSYILIYTCKAEYTKIKRKKKVCTCDNIGPWLATCFSGELELALRKREKKRVLFLSFIPTKANYKD